MDATRKWTVSEPKSKKRKSRCYQPTYIVHPLVVMSYEVEMGTKQQTLHTVDATYFTLLDSRLAGLCRIAASCNR